MSMLFCDGFDKYGPANSITTTVNALLTAGEWTTAPGAGNTIVAPLSATGFALNFTGSGVCIVKTLAGNQARLIGGFRFSSSLVVNVGISFQDAGTNQAGIRINTSGTISITNGGISGTATATSSASVTANSVHYLEFDVTFGNAGAYQIWLDGASILSGSGDTTTTANNFANQVTFGTVTSTGSFTIDDLYLFDTSGSTNNAVLLTSPRIETTFPISDSAVQFAVGAGILGSSVARSTSTPTSLAASLYLRRFTPPVACTLNSITLVPGASNATANYRGVVYADSGGVAGSLMSSGTQLTGVTNLAAANLPLTTPQSLSAGTPYWLGFMCDTAVFLQAAENSSLCYRAGITYASGAPGTAPAMAGTQPTFHYWGNLTGITGNWYEAAQQPPPGAYSYVFDATVNHEDLYNFTPLSAPPATVHGVALKAYCARSDSGAKTVSLRMKSGSTDSGGSSTGQTPATSFGWLASYFPTDPNTSAAWTGTNLDAATVGFKVDS